LRNCRFAHPSLRKFKRLGRFVDEKSHLMGRPPEASLGAPAAGRASAARVLLLVLVVAVVVAGGTFLLFRRAAEQVSGRVQATGTAVGSFTFTVDDCASGHAFVPGFFGADLRGDAKYDLRLVGSGDDAQLWLYPPDAQRGAILFGKADCATWEVRNDWAHVTVNRVDTVSGHVHVRCEGPRGGLAADVEFVRCAF
jgi:hypothetical protein